jgi:hypothetical protein
MVVDKQTGEVLMETEDIDVPSEEFASDEGTTFSAHDNELLIAKEREPEG